MTGPYRANVQTRAPLSASAELATYPPVTGFVSYADEQPLAGWEEDQGLRNIGAAQIRDPEYFNQTTDQANLQACIDAGADLNASLYVKLRPRTYTLGAVGDPSPGLTWDGSHGSIVLDARGARVDYLGTGALMSSTTRLGGNSPPTVEVLGGAWSGAAAAFGFYGLDVRSFHFDGLKTAFPVGAAIAQINQDVYCERNTYDRIWDSGSKHVLLLDMADYKSVPTGGVVTFTPGSNLATFTVPHTLRPGERMKFVGLSGSFGVVEGQRYYCATNPTNATLTLSSTPDGLTPVTITANGTAAQGWVEPAGSMARTRLFEAKLTGGTATFCKIKIANGAGPYDSHFGARGNIPDGVGVIDILGAGTMGNTSLDLMRCEAVSSIAGGAFIMRWGQSGGFPPSFEASTPVLRSMYMFDPLMPSPDSSKRIFGNHVFHGIESQAFQTNSYLDIYGRTNRATIGPAINPTLYLTDGSGAAQPESQIGNLILAGGGSSGKHVWADVSGGVGPAVYQPLDVLLDSTLACSTFLRVGATYNAVVGEIVRCKPTAAGTVNLPPAPQEGSRLVIMNLSTTGLVTVACQGTDVFNETGGATTVTLTSGKSIMVQYMAAQALWVIIAANPGAAVAAAIVPGQLLALKSYRQSTAQPQALTPAAFNVLSDLSAAAITALWAGATAGMFDLAFTCPPSGLVDVEIQGNFSVASGTTIAVRLAPFDVTANAAVTNSTAAVCSGTGSTRATYKQQFTLAPGTVYTWRPQWCTSNAANQGQCNAGGPGGTVRVAAYASA